MFHFQGSKDRFTFSILKALQSDIASNIALIKLLKFLNKPRKSLQKWVATPIIRYDASIDTDATNQLVMLKCKHQSDINISGNNSYGAIHTLQDGEHKRKSNALL